VCVCEKERECVCVREREGVCVCQGVLFQPDLSSCGVGEREREIVRVRVRVRVRVCAYLCLKKSCAL